LLQQNDKRPKLICIDKNFQIKKALFNDEWKQYPAFFSQSFDPDTFYIAIMRPGTEPLDFRNVVLKDFKVDLKFIQSREVQLEFQNIAYGDMARLTVETYPGCFLMDFIFL
jgi:hypothetical protein